MKRSRLLLVLVTLPFAIVKIAGGCAAQGEGQLCNVLNNISDDCASGLVCTPLNGYDACCPQSGSTNPACMAGGVVGDGGIGNGGGGGAGGAGGATASSSGTGGTGGMGTGGVPSDGGDAGDGGTGGMSNDGGDGGDAGDGG